MANVKFTKMDALTTLAKIEEVKANENLSAFVAHEIELLEKKKSYKSNTPSKRQAENMEILVPAIKKALAPGEKLTATEIATEVSKVLTMNVTAPRVTAQLTKLKANGEVVNEKVKGKSYYFLPLAEE